MRGGRCTVPFFAAYFFYYSGYCIFSSFMVLYLTKQGCSAALCGVISSISLLANLIMEPVGGYVADTFLPMKHYLLGCTGAVTVLCVLCTFLDGAAVLVLMILMAGISYPFSQLMDAWVDYSRKKDQKLVYSTVRAGGSVGFALVSFAAGYYFEWFGWEHYFLLQAVMFLIMVPFLLRLPENPLENKKIRERQESWLSFNASFKILKKNRPYVLYLAVCTVYWLSHRPVGSFLSLIVEGRAGSSGVYGSICGVGAVVEFLALLILAHFQKMKRLSPGELLGGAVALNIMRPFCIWLFSGLWPLYIGQIIQSVSFALFYAGSVACFSETSDERIRSFCVSVGLTISSVFGTVIANLAGGRLCDFLGTEILVIVSFWISIGNGIFLAFGKRKIRQFH